MTHHSTKSLIDQSLLTIQIKNSNNKNNRNNEKIYIEKRNKKVNTVKITKNQYNYYKMIILLF